jgi:magnesium-transporting ATPase (P-type)
MIDMVVYGLWMAALCLASFVLVLYGFGNGQADIGEACNERREGCEVVFRARATTFACLTWFALFLAWEMVNMRRSFFRMQPGSKRYFTQWMHDVWRNPFLFWAIIAGFVTMFPLIYIPGLNDIVFKHAPISWEWAIVFIEAFLFFLGIETWKWAKRIFLRRRASKKGRGGKDMDIEERVFGHYFKGGSGHNSGDERSEETSVEKKAQSNGSNAEKNKAQ